MSLFFVYDVRECSNFILLHVAVLFSQHHLLKRLLFLHCIVFLLCHKLIDNKCMGLFLGSLFCSTDLYVCFCASTILGFFEFFFSLFIYFWLHWIFVAACRLSLVAASRGYSSLRCVGFSLWWLLLLQNTGSRCVGFSSCGTWAQ